MALENGEKKTIADIRTLIAYDRIDEARSLSRPRLSGQADYMTSGEAKCVCKNKRNQHARASLVIPIFNCGLTYESVKSQKKLYEAALYDLDQVEQAILYAVNEAYFDLLVSQKLQWIVQQSMSSLESQLQVTRDHLEQGLLQRNEVLVLEVQLAQLQQDLIEAQHHIELARYRLNRLIGVEFDAPTEIQDLLLETCYEDNLGELIDTAKDNHPELLSLQAQIEAAERGYKAEKAHLYPNIYAFSNYSTTSDYALPYRQGLDAGIAVEMTFYDGGSTYAKMRRIRKEICEMKFRYQELERDIELKIRSAFLTIRSALNKVPVSLKGVQLSEENLRLTKDLFQEGLVTNVDIVNDEQSLAQSRLNYYEALYTYHRSRANLIYAAGIMYKKGCL